MFGRDSGAECVSGRWSARGAYTDLVHPCLATYDYPYRPWLATCDLPNRTRAPPYPSACGIRPLSNILRELRAPAQTSPGQRLVVFRRTLTSFVLSTSSMLPAASILGPEPCLTSGSPTRLSFVSSCCWAPVRLSTLVHPPTIAAPDDSSNPKQYKTKAK